MNSLRRKRILQTATQLLNEADIHAPKVDVERIVRMRGFGIVRNNGLGNDVSGFVTLVNDKTVIGINSRQSDVRRRFTLAHELGHALLHNLTPMNPYFDRQDVQFSGLRFRDNESSTGLIIEEREANLFASELLMPTRFLEDSLRLGSYKIDMTDNSNSGLSQLAKDYGVSVQAMAYRLANLGYLDL